VGSEDGEVRARVVLTSSNFRHAPSIQPWTFDGWKFDQSAITFCPFSHAIGSSPFYTVTA
jgi:hypothetical protein